MLAYNQIASNKRKTAILIGGFLIVIIGLAYIFYRVYNNPDILLLGVIISSAMSIVSYYYSDKITLAISGAKPVDRTSGKELYRVVENLAITAGLPTPGIYIIDEPAMNAFATGRDPQHAVVCVTTGLLQKLDKTQLEGVIAHELSHIGNYDIRLSTIVVILAGILTLIADWFLRFSFWGSHRSERNDSGNRQAQGILLIIGLALAILAPIAATIIQLAISRKREYLADASGVLLTRYPEGLASALETIKIHQKPLPEASKATAHLYIVNPLKGSDDSSDDLEDQGGPQGGFFANLFNTHPPINDRIKKLRAMNI